MSAKRDHTEPLVLDTLTIAEPSFKKSPVMSLIKRPYIQFAHDWNESNKQDIFTAQAERKLLQSKLEALEKKKDVTAEEIAKLQMEISNIPPSNFRRIAVDDVTPESLVNLLEENGTLLMISDEAGMLGNFSGRYSNNVPNLDLLLKSWNGETYISDRATRGSIVLKKPYMSICLACQPYVFDGMINNPVFRGSGLIARFMYCFPVSNIGTRKYDTQAVPEQVAENYKNLVYKLLGAKFTYHDEKELYLHFDAKAYGEFVDYYNNFIEPHLVTDMAFCKDWGGKYHGELLRLCGIIHCIKCALNDVNPVECRVTLDTFCNAIEIGEYFREQAIYAYSLGDVDLGTIKAERVLNKIRSKHITSIRQNDLYKLCRCTFFRNAADFAETIDMLEEYRYIFRNTSKGTPNNVILIQQPIAEAYDQLFKKSTERYNARQKRNDRKIGDYYEHLFGCKPCNTVKVNALDQKSFYEVVVQIGKREDSGIGTEDEQLVADCLKEYMEGFQNRNPNFYVFNAVLHMDEATPHLHFDYIPVGHYKRGQDTQNGIAQALKEMGYGGGKMAIARWRAAEVEVLNKICLEHGIKPLAPEKARGTLEVEEYKEQRRQADELAVQNTQAQYQLELKKTMLASTETQLSEQKKLLGDTQRQVREATADLIEQGHKLEDSEAELSEVKEKISKAEQEFGEATAKIEKIMNYLPNIIRDTKLEDRYHDLSSQLKGMTKSSMSIIKHKDGIISAVDELEMIVKKSTDSAYKAAKTVYDLREYGAKTSVERDDALEKLKAVRKEKTDLSSELKTVKSEVRRYSEVYAMLERIAPDILDRAKALVQEEKAQRQREQAQQIEYQPTKKKTSWGLE